MQIIVISNSADFFTDVHHICRPLFPAIYLQHVSLEAWEQTDLSAISSGTWLILDAMGNGTSGRSKEPSFAAVRFIEGHAAESNFAWETLSRTAFLLLSTQISSGQQCPSDQPCAAQTADSDFYHQVLLQSDDVRITEYKLASRRELIPKVRSRLLDSIQEFSLVSGTGENHFCMALDEALANAFYHGNLELCSLLKEDGSSRFTQLAAERESQQPWCQRQILVTEMASRFGLWITIQDEGRGFDVRGALQRCEDPETLVASGRGLMLMQAFADEMFFNNTGNQVTLVLYSRAARNARSESGLMQAENDGCLSVF